MSPSTRHSSFWYYTLRIGGLGIALIAVLFLGLGLNQRIALRRFRESTLPPGQLVDVGGYRMHIRCAGSGTPTIVVDAGNGCFGLEWTAIQEAQQARGVWPLRRVGWRCSLARVGNLVALTVPAVVLTAKRAWGMTEAAYARGFGAPHRQPFRQLAMAPLDWALFLGAIVVTAFLSYWHWRMI